MAGRARGYDLSVSLTPETLEGGRSKRARRATAQAVGSSEGEGEQEEAVVPADRPTDDERAAALQIISALKEADAQPPLLAQNASADAAVVACALAFYFGQQFSSDRDAKEQFGLGR